MQNLGKNSDKIVKLFNGGKRYDWSRTTRPESDWKGDNMSERTPEKDLSDLRERVVRLEVQMAEITKRLDAINSYTRQLYEYLNKLGR